MIRKKWIAFVLCCACAGHVCAHDNISMRRDSVQLNTAEQERRTQEFYDTLAVRSSRRWLPRLLHNTLVRKLPAPTAPNPEAVDESRKYRPYSDRPIASIEIITRNVLDNPENDIGQATNALHSVTKNMSVRRDLLFREGDRVDPAQMVRTTQLLRERGFLYDVSIELSPIDADTTAVAVRITTRDKWTISADGSISLNGRTTAEVYDANIFGLGDRLSLKTSFDWRTFGYRGNLVEYRAPNIFGTFCKGRFKFGRQHDDRYLESQIYKEFIQPTDYEVGFIFDRSEHRHSMINIDTAVTVRTNNFDLWGGRSYHVPQLSANVYMMLRYNIVHYLERSEVAPELNPYFHNGRMLMLSVGAYRERFLTANMIYGFGFKEYVATGFRAELVGGYNSGEFYDSWYGGAQFKIGSFTPYGYMTGSIACGSYYRTDEARFLQGVVSGRIEYFTNLLNIGTHKMRQFITLSYMTGINRNEGAREAVSFTGDNKIRSMRYNATGRNRLLLSTETVLFTPWQYRGFNTALYGFCDFGLLGNCSNILRDPFYSCVGIGIRLKNERLVFSTIQLQLGIAFSRDKLLSNDWIMLTNEQRLHQQRYIPQKPSIVEYY